MEQSSLLTFRDHSLLRRQMGNKREALELWLVIIIIRETNALYAFCQVLFYILYIYKGPSNHL